jgi:hypothetical protein
MISYPEPKFANAKVGDKVIYTPAGFYAGVRRVLPIEKVTKTQVLVHGTWYNRETGRQIGGSRSHITRIQPSTPMLIEEVTKEARQHDLRVRLKGVEWGKIELPVLEKLAAVLWEKTP